MGPVRGLKLELPLTSQNRDWFGVRRQNDCDRRYRVSECYSVDIVPIIVGHGPPFVRQRATARPPVTPRAPPPRGSGNDE